VKAEYVVVGDEELARSVSRRVATVTAETLRVRTEAGLDAAVLGLVPEGDDLTVIDESIDGWVGVSMEEGNGYVSDEYVTLSTEYIYAESKAEEEARLAKEEEARKAAAAAAAAASKSSSSSSTSSSSSAATTTYSAPSGSDGQAVVDYACQFVGNPYKYGGSSLTNGTDCSGFVMSVYAAFGVSLPHSSKSMRTVGYGVSVDEMQPGDIICYSGHVAIYVGNNTIVHASTPSTGIKYTSPANYKTILAVRRIF
jgi:cell wall-associated NlpC family hydrolase